MSDTDCNKLVAMIIVIVLAPEKKSGGRVLYTLTSLALQNQVQY